jgi:flagellar basal-body rod protein FlgB
MEVLAKNIANADTPNYKARDLDFKSALAAASGGAGPGAALALTTTDPRQIGSDPTQDASPSLKYRVPLAPSLDGNTVDAQLEQAAFADNTVRYQATLTFLSTRLRDLMTAITGS